MTGNSTPAPGRTLTGKGNLPKENSLPCSDLEVIRSVSFPVFKSLKEKELELPIRTLPKLCPQGSQ
jgi:hypothetical protein